MSIEYKKIIKSQRFRFMLLKILGFIPDSLMLQIQYKIKFGRKLDLKNPKRFTEKIQYYKLHYRNPILGKCVDKYGVREYIKSKGLEGILNEIYFISEDVKNIDFDSLPNQFVIKTTDGGGGQNIIICKDKDVANWDEIKKKLNSWKNKKNINAGREWAYTQIDKSCYIGEKYLLDDSRESGDLVDYKFFCFNGEPKIIQVNLDRYTDHKEIFFNNEWNRLELKLSYDTSDCEVKKPENFQELLDIVRRLSGDFPFVRVDLYNIHNKPIFGELTFYPSSGYAKFVPEKWDEILGSYMNLDFGTFYR